VRMLPPEEPSQSTHDCPPGGGAYGRRRAAPYAATTRRGA
jgi:hypothetical protein